MSFRVVLPGQSWSCPPNGIPSSLASSLRAQCQRRRPFEYIKRKATYGILSGSLCTTFCLGFSLNENTPQSSKPSTLQQPQFDMDLVSSPRTSQSSQFSNSMRSPTTDVASSQSSQLAHPSYFSNPALMDDSNLPSLHLDTDYVPTHTRGRGRCREPSPSPPLSPASSTPHQPPRSHTYASHFLSTLTIAPPS